MPVLQKKALFSAFIICQVLRIIQNYMEVSPAKSLILSATIHGGSYFFIQPLIYFCHELDMRHLCRIKQEIGWKQKGTIICLDYQANVLRAYFGEGVRVRELNTDKIMEYLTKGRDE